MLDSKLLRKTIRILRAHHIRYWLDSETLLGLMRDRIGSHLSWTQDINVSVPGDHFPQLLALKNEWGFSSRIKHIPDRSGREWIGGEHSSLTLLPWWAPPQTARRVSITPKYKVGDQYRWVDKRSCKWIDKKFYDDLDMIEVSGEQFPIPANAEEYLERRYAEWQRPNPAWISSIDDGALVPAAVIQAVPRKPTKSRAPLAKIQLRHRDYHRRMKEMLLATVDILNENGIKYWLEAGTLLGVLRDGDLIPWDYDADLGIPGDAVEDIMRLRLRFLPRYLIKRRPIQTPWLPGDTRAIKVKTPWEKLKQINFHLDLFCVYLVGDEYRWVDTNTLKHVNRRFYDSLDSIEWEGRPVAIPAHAEEYLTLRYGDWLVPDPDFNPSRDDGAIAEKGF